MKYVKGIMIAVLAMVLTMSGDVFAGRGRVRIAEQEQNVHVHIAEAV